MKATSKAPLTTGRGSRSSITLSLLNKKYYVLLLAAFSIAGMTSVIKAGNGFQKDAAPLVINDTVQGSLHIGDAGNAPGVNGTAQAVTVAVAADNTPAETGSVINTNLTETNTGTTDSIGVVTLVADYCIVAGMVRITANASPSGATYKWSTGETGPVINVDIANMYHVIAYFSNGDSAKASIKVAEELVTNGDFTDGNTGFYSEYGYTADVAGNSELNPEGLYAVGTSGQNYHGQFFGKEHTSAAQTGKFMIVNGSTSTIGSPARQRTIWQQTVPVLPNTNYYFSAYAMNVNPSSPARLQFEVNGVLVGTIADLNIASKPYSDGAVNINNWVRFYSNPTWNSAGSTTAVIRIINLNTDASGNDFGLDDISFSTLSPFITLVSPAGTDGQSTCLGGAINPIVYSVGSDASGHSILNLPAGVTASFDVPNFLSITGTPVAAGSYTYSITTIGTCNPVTVTGTIGVSTSLAMWSGSLSNDWSEAGNWLCGNVPNDTTNVIIPSGALRMPMLTAASVCKQLKMEAATVLNLNGQLLTNYGGVTGPGLLKGSSTSALTIDAAGTTSSVSFDQSVPGTANALKNLTIKGSGTSVSLKTKLALYGSLAPQNGTLIINDTLVLRSTATGTARVDVVTGALAYGTIGNVEVERYFPARRAWRLLTSPLTKTGTIFDTWQNGGKYVAGKGTFVSGATAVSPTSANGLDWSPMNNASLKVGVSLTPVSNTRVNLSKNLADTSDNVPYFIFVRGDRNPVNTNTAFSNTTTLSSTGRLQTGKQTFKASSSQGGFTFVGNPYAAPVDFNKLVLTNLKKHFWVWDPYLNTDQGGFVLVEEITTGHYDMIPHSPGGLNQLLQSGQAFFVETASNGPASIVFQEASKTSAATNLTAFRPMGEMPSFRANIYHLNDDASTQLLDGVMVLFDSSFSRSVDDRDVLKQSNTKEMLSLVRDNKTLTLERMPLLVATDTLFLRLTKSTQRKYRLEFEPVGLDPLLTAFLDDSYTGLNTALNATQSSTYDFEINGDAASAVPNRFKIFFRQVAAPLPVTYKSISAKQVEDDILVRWTVENEVNIRAYEVEKSTNGIDFEKVNTTTATGANSMSAEYKFLDQYAVAGDNYYRVKSVSASGKYEYSKTVVVRITKTASGISIFPNPSPADNIGVTFRNMEDGIYKARLLNTLGQTMMATSIVHSRANPSENIAPGKTLGAGVYQLVVSAPDHTVTTIKVIIR